MVEHEDVVSLFLSQARRVWERASITPYASVNHLALFVPDLNQAEEQIRQAFGLEPMRLPEDDPAFSDQRYSIFWQGDCFWELIEPRQGLDTSVFTRANPFGYFSEVGYFVPDITSEVKRLTGLGWVVHYSHTGDAWKEVHIRPDPPSGLMIELIEFGIQ